MSTVRHLLRLALACALLAGSAAQATALRIASAFDPQTMDPHALALLYHSRVVFQVYESLVGATSSSGSSRRWPRRGR